MWVFIIIDNIFSVSGVMEGFLDFPKWFEILYSSVVVRFDVGGIMGF